MSTVNNETYENLSQNGEEEMVKDYSWGGYAYSVFPTGD